MKGNRPNQLAGFASSAAVLYAEQLKAYLRRRLCKPHEVDDLAQEVYLRLLRLGEDKIVRNSLAYIYGIAAHVLADFRFEVERTHAHLKVDLESTQLESGEVFGLLLEDPLGRLNMQQQLERALAQLPPIQTAVLLSIKRDGMSYEEVALKLNLSVDMVHKHINRAKTRLRTMTWEW